MLKCLLIVIVISLGYTVFLNNFIKHTWLGKCLDLFSKIFNLIIYMVIIV